MSWIKRHNAEVFRKHVRDELCRRLSDKNKNYFCSVESEQIGWWYGREMYRLNVSFSYCNVTLTMRLGSVQAYWDYQNETVDSACDKIIDNIKYHCHRFTADKATAYNRECFSVDFLMNHVLELLGDEKRKEKENV